MVWTYWQRDADIPKLIEELPPLDADLWRSKRRNTTRVNN